MPSPDAIVLPEVTTVEVRFDPVQTIINSMVLLIRSEDLSGLNPWIYETAAAMSPEQKAKHNLVVIGFHYAVVPKRFWKDFPTFLNYLGKCDPFTLRDNVLDFYLDFDCCEEAEKKIEATRETLLGDVNFFLEYLISKFGEKHVDPKVESKAFELLNAPVEMQKIIVSHLEFMWEEYYQAEWAKISPMLSDAVMAFEEIDFSVMSRDEAAKYITGQEVSPDFWEKTNQDAQHLIFGKKPTRMHSI